MSDRPAISRPPTRQRLLDAAARVFARDGLTGATTRAIAQEAGVNEVTLFRHFQTKEKLLAAVVGENFGATPSEEAATAPSTGDLRADLLVHAHYYDRLLHENLPLVRTMIGEIHHHDREQERQVFKGVFRPLRLALIKRLENAQAAGDLHPQVRVDVLADLFGGMIFTGVLRRSSPHISTDYSSGAYIEAAVDLVVRGAAAK